MADKPKKKKEISVLQSGLAGGIVGAIEISITYPTEYVKTVMQLNERYRAMGITGVFRHVYSTQGFLGLYKGYSALLLFAIPKNTVRFGAFQYAQQNVFTNK